MHFMHSSIRNEIDDIRYTCDVRFQPKAEPMDDRWATEDSPGHTSEGAEPNDLATYVGVDAAGDLLGIEA